MMANVAVYGILVLKNAGNQLTGKAGALFRQASLRQEVLQRLLRLMPHGIRSYNA